jgi:hypothetical protein
MVKKTKTEKIPAITATAEIPEIVIPEETVTAEIPVRVIQAETVTSATMVTVIAKIPARVIQAVPEHLFPVKFFLKPQLHKE